MGLLPLPRGVSYALCMACAGNVVIGIGDVLTDLSIDVGSTSVGGELRYDSKSVSLGRGKQADCTGSAC